VRSQDVTVEWIDNNGTTYDYVGRPPLSPAAEAKWRLGNDQGPGEGTFLRSVLDHLSGKPNADFIVIDTTNLTLAQATKVVNYTKKLNIPRYIGIGPGGW